MSKKHLSYLPSADSAGLAGSTRTLLTPEGVAQMKQEEVSCKLFPLSFHFAICPEALTASGV